MMARSRQPRLKAIICADSEPSPSPSQRTSRVIPTSHCVLLFLQVISLEGWTDIMYYVQDAHSFWDWIYFVLLIVVSSLLVH